MKVELPHPLTKHINRNTTSASEDQKRVPSPVKPIFTIVLMDFDKWAQDWRDADTIQYNRKK